ncbi:MAG: rhodanese-like domain-containing protein [Oscillospiraceae bacterium]|nr:rhodanese-like domain-containing protein [Oscillospiraceae bacterium]
MSMKKTLITLLISLPLAMFLVACGGEGEQYPEPPPIGEQHPEPPPVSEVADMSQFDVRRLIDRNQPHVFVDVRSAEEFAERSIEDTVNIPLDQSGEEPSIDLSAFPADKDAPILVICRTQNRSRIAADLLVQAGYTNVTVVIGGTSAWFAFCDRV